MWVAVGHKGGGEELITYTVWTYVLKQLDNFTFTVLSFLRN